MANAIDARLEGLVAQIKFSSSKVHRPFANDPELKRICNRLGNSGNQLAGWISERNVTGYAQSKIMTRS